MTWRLRVPKAITLLSQDATEWRVEGEGPAPVAEVLAPPSPPLPELDDSPFPFPPQPPFSFQDDPTARWTYWGTDPWTHLGFLVALPEYANPDPAHYLSAGFPLRGSRLWAPRDARPGAIRFILATGKKWA